MLERSQPTPNKPRSITEPFGPPAEFAPYRFLLQLKETFYENKLQVSQSSSNGIVQIELSGKGKTGIDHVLSFHNGSFNALGHLSKKELVGFDGAANWTTSIDQESGLLQKI